MMELLSSALVYPENGKILTKESVYNVQTLSRILECWRKDMSSELLNALSNEDFQRIEKLYSIYYFNFIKLSCQKNGTVHYLVLLHKSEGRVEEKSRVIYNYIFPQFANDSSFRFAVDSFFNSELNVAKYEEIETRSFGNGNTRKAPVDKENVIRCDAIQYLLQILLITKSETIIENLYGIGNVVSFFREHIVSEHHGNIGKDIYQVEYLKV